MQAVGAVDWIGYREYLEQHPDEFRELFNTILINVTGFFRDKETWDLLATEVIPKVLEAKSPDSSIRCWSAGCASGEEPYTMAMLFADAVGEDEFPDRVRIYATDVDEDALGQARDAAYSSKELGDVPPELRERYFQPAATGFAFRPDLWRSVIFGRNDLLKDPPISRVDLLVSRNTLMYFGPDAQERVLANFYFGLNRDGFLVVGKAEALQAGRRLFSPYHLKRRVFVKDGAAPPSFHFPRLPLPLDANADVTGGLHLGEAAFEHAPIAQLVVDAENRVLAMNRAARAMFGLKVKDVGRNLQDLELWYRPVELRPLIDDVLTRHRIASEKSVRWQTPKGQVRSLDVQVTPLVGSGERRVGVTVSFVDVSAHRTLEENLERARRELETAYEELQATVEELETTNEELSSTNEELETMNDELRERTEETLRANSFLGSVLSSIEQAVVVLDRELRVLAWNQLATELWGLRDEEVEGQHLLNLDIGLPVAQLRDPLRRILAGESADPLVLDGHNRRGDMVTYSAQFAPLASSRDGAAEGAILFLTSERHA
jgi:two-component system CheB/CheR fusion protein